MPVPPLTFDDNVTNWFEQAATREQAPEYHWSETLVAPTTPLNSLKQYPDRLLGSRFYPERVKAGARNHKSEKSVA
jgi:hypothetical protein